MESCRKHGIWGPLEAGDRRDTGLGELCVSVRFWLCFDEEELSMRTRSAPQHWTWECSGRNHNNAVPIAFLHTNHPVLYRNVYSTTYVGHMQTNKLTTLWQPQVPRSCVCNRNVGLVRLKIHGQERIDMAAPVRECGVCKAPKVRAEYVYKALHPADRRDVGHATVVMTDKRTLQSTAS